MRRSPSRESILQHTISTKQDNIVVAGLGTAVEEFRERDEGLESALRGADG